MRNDHERKVFRFASVPQLACEATRMPLGTRLALGGDGFPRGPHPAQPRVLRRGPGELVAISPPTSEIDNQRLLAVNRSEFGPAMGIRSTETTRDL